jgi:hypothetical protein
LDDEGRQFTGRAAARKERAQSLFVLSGARAPDINPFDQRCALRLRLHKDAQAFQQRLCFARICFWNDAQLLAQLEMGFLESKNFLIDACKLFLKSSDVVAPSNDLPLEIGERRNPIRLNTQAVGNLVTFPDRLAKLGKSSGMCRLFQLSHLPITF